MAGFVVRRDGFVAVVRIWSIRARRSSQGAGGRRHWRLEARSAVLIAA
jgi:hypothetical protein